MTHQVTCKVCTKDFYVGPSRFKRGNVKCCSMACSAVSRIGRPPTRGRTGMPHTSETKRKMRGNSGQRGEKSHMWKGDNVGYGALHRWIEGMHGKAVAYRCRGCFGTSGSARMEWANATGIYNRDKENWIPLCRKCHCKYDIDVFGARHGKHGKWKKKMSSAIVKAKLETLNAK